MIAIQFALSDIQAVKVANPISHLEAAPAAIVVLLKRKASEELKSFDGTVSSSL